MDFRQYLKQSYGEYFPLIPLAEFVESGYLVVSRKSKSAVYSSDFDQVLPFDYAFITNVKKGRALAIQMEWIGSKSKFWFFLMDLKTGSHSIELTLTEF